MGCLRIILPTSSLSLVSMEPRECCCEVSSVLLVSGVVSDFVTVTLDFADWSLFLLFDGCAVVSGLELWPESPWVTF